MYSKTGTEGKTVKLSAKCIIRNDCHFILIFFSQNCQSNYLMLCSHQNRNMLIVNRFPVNICTISLFTLVVSNFQARFTPAFMIYAVIKHAYHNIKSLHEILIITHEPKINRAQICCCVTPIPRHGELSYGKIPLLP